MSIMSTITSKEQKIIEAAKIVFMEKGLEGTKMQDIADEAGISRTSLNYYYRSKEKLFDSLVEKLINIFAPRLMKIMEGEKNLEIKVELLVDEYTELIITNPQYPYFIITEITRNPQQFIKILKNRIFEFGDLQALRDKLTMENPKYSAELLDLPQLILSIVSLLITPSLVWPAFQKLTEYNVEFEDYLRGRKKYVKAMIKAQIGLETIR